MERPSSMVEDSRVWPEFTPPAASYVALSDSCEYCSVDSIVQDKTKSVWGNLSAKGESIGRPRRCLGCNTVMCCNCVELFKPVLLKAFKSQDDALDQWPYMAAMQSEATCASCPACSIPMLELGSTAESFFSKNRNTGCTCQAPSW
jgi:hypothetical protein